MRWGGRGAVHDRVFASLAYVRTRLDEDVPWLIFLLPQQLEVGWQRSAGSDRVGVTLSYGI